MRGIAASPLLVRLLLTNGATVRGGPIVVRPVKAARIANGVLLRAEILATLLDNPAGLSVWQLGQALHRGNSSIESAINGLTLECPALYTYADETGKRPTWIEALDLDEWAVTGWHAGALVDDRGVRMDKVWRTSDAGGYLPTARVSWTNGRLRVAA